MFVSQPQYEFPLPAAFGDLGYQHWRLVELSFHTPWFMVSIEVCYDGEPDIGRVRTLCIAWELDLVEVLRSLDASRVKGVVCMLPAWQSPSGQWSSREIREVWLHVSAAGQHVVLCDFGGETFDSGLVPAHVEPVKKELLLRLAPAKARKLRPRSTGRPVGRRRNAAAR